MNDYLPTLADRQKLVLTQIAECQTMVYRNNLENLTFIEKNDEDKQLEVSTNNKILSKKIDVLSKEYERLVAEGEASSNTTK